MQAPQSLTYGGKGHARADDPTRLAAPQQERRGDSLSAHNGAALLALDVS